MAEKSTVAAPLIVTSEPEPVHGCCVRIIMAPAALVAFVPATAFAVAELVTAPIQCLALVVCKLTICNCCCPDSIHHCFRNVVFSPCRWCRICATGKGHVVCWKHPAWPFREN